MTLVFRFDLPSVPFFMPSSQATNASLWINSVAGIMSRVSGIILHMKTPQSNICLLRLSRFQIQSKEARFRAFVMICILFLPSSQASILPSCTLTALPDSLTRLISPVVFRSIRTWIKLLLPFSTPCSIMYVWPCDAIPNLEER